ncbi:MAG: protein-disulfide reductase DsbD family protein [Pseudomonadota bacterium]|nr:protein-disulfide reductase DsbD family protein [Pseudomonadota bacterium]
MLLPWSTAEAAEPPPPVHVSIVAPAEMRIGGTAEVAVVLDVPKGWHIYWENPGQSGLSTDARLTVAHAGDCTPPAGRVVTGPRWPVPKRFEADGLVNYGYDGVTAFVFELHAPATSRLPLEAQVSWLLCKDVCVPGSGSATASVAVRGRGHADASSAQPPAMAPLLEALAAPFEQSGGTVSLSGGQLRVTLPGPGPFDVFPSVPLEAEWAPTITVSPDGALLLSSPLPRAPGGSPWPFHLVLTRGEGATRRGYTLDLRESP